MSTDMSQNSPDTSEAEKLRPPAIVVETAADGSVELHLSGSWITRAITLVDESLEEIGERQKVDFIVDLDGVQQMDTAGAWLIIKLRELVASRGQGFSVHGASEDQTVLLEAVHRTMTEGPEKKKAAETASLPVRFLANVGEGVMAGRRDLMMGLHILGAAVHGSQMKEGRVNRVSFAPIAAQIDKMGVRAIPIVALMATIIGAIIAQQGAFQLRYFGAEIFVVDLVSILVLREIGVLITAIMIAGRSGSAITAEIGSMRMREEVDALTVMGLNPIAVLVFPRLVALTIALPLLTFMANIAALGGAMVVADLYSGISYDSFINRLRQAVDLTSLFSGLIKAPFMAIIIGIIASVEGMKVGGSAESLGSHVTASVVKSIFVVIVVDGIFAIFFAQIDF